MRNAYINLIWFQQQKNEQLLPEKVRCQTDRTQRSNLSGGNLVAQEGTPKPAPSPSTSSIICARTHTLPLSFMCAHMLFPSLQLSLAHACTCLLTQPPPHPNLMGSRGRQSQPLNEGGNHAEKLFSHCLSQVIVTDKHQRASLFWLHCSTSQCFISNKCSGNVNSIWLCTMLLNRNKNAVY